MPLRFARQSVSHLIPPMDYVRLYFIYFWILYIFLKFPKFGVVDDDLSVCPSSKHTHHLQKRSSTHTHTQRQRENVLYLCVGSANQYVCSIHLSAWTNVRLHENKWLRHSKISLSRIQARQRRAKCITILQRILSMRRRLGLSRRRCCRQWKITRLTALTSELIEFDLTQTQLCARATVCFANTLKF